MPSIFISYSHRDESWKSRLETQLKVFQHEDVLDVWTDRCIREGDSWRSEIRTAIDRASVAVLLISAHSLSSEFILWEEVPLLLRRRQRDGLSVIPVIVEPSGWGQVDWLADIQCVHADGKALSRLEEAEAEQVLADVARKVAALAIESSGRSPFDGASQQLTQSIHNNTQLYTGLYLFSQSLKMLAVRQLKNHFGRGWWKEGVVRALGEKKVAQMEALWARRHRTRGEAPEDHLEDLLEVGNLLPVLQANWKACFASIFPERDKAEVWLKEIVEIRNLVMHPESTPVPEADARRGLELMQRYLTLIDEPAAHEFLKLRDESTLGSTWAGGGSELFEDYEFGFAKLAAAVAAQTDPGSEPQERLEHLFLQLSNRLWRKTLVPADHGPAEAGQIRLLTLNLDNIAREFTGVPFTELCARDVEPPSLDPEAAIRVIKELDDELGQLRQELLAAEKTKRLQLMTGDVLASLERKLGLLERRLDTKQEERARLLEESSPDAYFTVRRRLTPGPDGVYGVEQRIKVDVDIHNEGTQAAEVAFVEALPPVFQVLDGSLEVASLVQPGQTVCLGYTMYPATSGSYSLNVGSLEYRDRCPSWDRLEKSKIVVEPATEPNLEVARYYELELNGLRLLVDLHNHGQKIARAISYRETVRNGRPAKVEWKGELYGGKSVVVVSDLFHARPDEVKFEQEVDVPYSSSSGRKYSCRVSPELKRISYAFPTAQESEAKTFGRARELERLEALVESARTGQAGKRLLLIEGIEGTGKTRLVHELRSFAQGFAVLQEDCKSRSPVKRMLRQLLGLTATEDRDEKIRRSFLASPLGRQHGSYWEPILLFLAGRDVEADPDQMALLETQLAQTVRALCHHHQTLLVLENLQWIPPGLENRLLVRLLQTVALDRSGSIVVCATYRPAERASVPVVSSLGIARDLYEHFELDQLSEVAIRELVDHIVTFPRFDATLHQAVARYSRNPLYVIELVRLLTQPESPYIWRVGSEWRLAPGVEIERVVPRRIEDLIQQRIEEELPETIELVRALSAIGFELPRALVDHVAKMHFADWDQHELSQQLKTLEYAGILVGGEETEYRFEHHLKREVMYDSVPRHEKPSLRQEIAEFLLQEVVFEDRAEQLRQLARHIVKSPRGFQIKHLDSIRRAAAMEARLGNLGRSLEFLDVATALVPDKGFEKVELLIEGGRQCHSVGDWISAATKLETAHRLLSLGSELHRIDRKRARRLQIVVDKQRGLLKVDQPRATVGEADKLLRNARLGLEGTLRLGRFLPPKRLAFYRDLVEIYIGLAEIWIRKGNFVLSRRALIRARALARKATRHWPKEPLHADVERKLGDLYRRQGDLANSRRHFEAALQSGGLNEYQTERLWLQIAETHYAEGQFEAAREAYERAIAGQRDVSDHFGLAMSYQGLGELLARLEDYEAALDYCMKAYEFQRKSGDIGRFWRSCTTIATIEVVRGHPERAARFWQEARAVLFEQDRYLRITGDRRQEIADLAEGLASHFDKIGDDQAYRLCLNDRWLLSKLDPGDDKVTLLRLGEADLRVQDFESALRRFEEALKAAAEPSVRAEALERLGETLARYEADSELLDELGVPDTEDAAEHFLKLAIQQCLRADLTDRALSVFDRLLDHMLGDESVRFELPTVIFAIFRDADSPDTRKALLTRAEDRLSNAGMSIDAADLLIYASRHLVTRLPEAQREEVLLYLQEAEAMYRQGDATETIWGLNMLIPVYFQLGGYLEKVTTSFEQILDLSTETMDTTGFLATYQSMVAFHRALPKERLERILNAALAAYSGMGFSYDQQMEFGLLTAKYFSRMADQESDEDEAEKSSDVALQYYEDVLSNCLGETTELLALAATALNDSAVILSRDDPVEAIRRYREAMAIDIALLGEESACEVRVNLAIELRAVGEIKEARSQFENGIRAMRKRLAIWNERVEQDAYSLSADDVARIQVAKRGLAWGLFMYAGFLMEYGPRELAASLAQEAAEGMREVQDQSADAAEFLAGFAKAMSEMPVSIRRLLEEKQRELGSSASRHRPDSPEE